MKTQSKEFSEVAVLPGIFQTMRLPRGCCPECGERHDPKEPHNPYTPYYQLSFSKEFRRNPTWADAMAHCPAAVKAHWRVKLRMEGIII